MQILNIEDNVFKHVNICKALKKIGITDVDWKRNLSEAINAMKTTKYDVVITDMWYPEYPGGPNIKSGEAFINKCIGQEDSPYIILCSSIDYDWPGIWGSVHYDEDEDWESHLLELIRKV